MVCDLSGLFRLHSNEQLGLVGSKYNSYPQAETLEEERAFLWSNWLFPYLTGGVIANRHYVGNLIEIFTSIWNTTSDFFLMSRFIISRTLNCTYLQLYRCLIFPVDSHREIHGITMTARNGQPKDNN